LKEFEIKIRAIVFTVIDGCFPVALAVAFIIMTLLFKIMGRRIKMCLVEKMAVVGADPDGFSKSKW